MILLLPTISYIQLNGWCFDDRIYKEFVRRVAIAVALRFVQFIENQSMKDKYWCAKMLINLSSCVVSSILRWNVDVFLILLIPTFFSFNRLSLNVFVVSAACSFLLLLLSFLYLCLYSTTNWCFVFDRLCVRCLHLFQYHFKSQ